MRYGAFDGMRGLAALAVVLFHMGQVKLIGGVVPHAYLAVDFFFVLSGFVIAYTYEGRLVAGMSLPDFLSRRAIRLYPMAVLAVALGAAVLLLKAHANPSRVDPLGRILSGIGSNIVMMPSPFGGAASQGFLFSGNGPLWSISVEIFINIVWCLVLARASTPVLATMVALCFALVVIFVAALGSANLGFDWHTLPGGLARVGYGFGLGVLLCRFRERLTVTRSTILKAAGIILLIAAFAAPRLAGSDALWDIGCVALAIPFIVLLGLNSTDHPRLDTLLGDLSYPLYATHFPILLLASGLHQTMPRLGVVPLLAGTIVAMMVATIAALKLYDEPVRRALTKRLRGRGHRKAAGPAETVPIMTGKLAA